jgi:hypothetical protein
LKKGEFELRKKTVLGVMLALFFIGITLNVTQVSSIENLSFHQVHAQAKLSRRVFRGVGDIEEPYWQHIYVINPTRHTVMFESVQLDFYADGFQISYLLTPDNYQPERWNTEVLPFEKSLVLYHGWIVGEEEPEGVYLCHITVHATVNGEDIELQARSIFRVFL